MARFEFLIPKEELAQLEKLATETDEIFGSMVKAGADVVYANINANMPAAFLDSEIRKCLKITKVYKTPSDDGINCKVAYYGYFKNKRGVRTPAPLVANIFEFGRSGDPFTKHPFIRKAFKRSAIEKAMLEAQKNASGGILESDES